MNTDQSENKYKNSRASNLRALGTFFVCGCLSGLLFAWLIRRASLLEFFFFRSGKFYIPRYSYRFAFGFSQLFGLAIAYIVSVSKHWTKPIQGTGLLFICAIVALGTPALRLITPAMNSVIGLNWDFLVAPIAFLFLLACTLCIASGGPKLLPLAVIWQLVFTAIGFTFIYLIQSLFQHPNDFYEYSQWPVLEGMLALSFCLWLIWRRP